MFEVLKYIHENIDKNLVSSDIAKQFGYSKWHFCTRFHEYTGKTFVKYVRHYRLHLAALDIMSGKKSTEVALDHGYHSAASPDGRRKGEIIAYSVSPMQGRDFNGLTSVLNSIAKLPTKRTPGTTSAIVEVVPKLFIDKNIPMLTDILLASSEKGLQNVQFNTIDADTLIDAQKHPEKYNNLAVRVSGFSQKFNLLSPELQNHIIGRTKHSCM